jgi:cold shock CspA family protein
MLKYLFKNNINILICAEKYLTFNIEFNIINVLLSKEKTFFMHEGKIVHLGKGFGFIKIEGRSKDLFFHLSSLLNASFAELQIGDGVTIGNIDTDKSGKEIAKSINLI